MATKPIKTYRVSEESELETLSSVNSYPDCSPPSYFQEEEEEEEDELEAGPSDPLFPSTSGENDDIPQDGDGDAFTQKWQPGFKYKDRHAVLNRSEERYVYGTTNARYSKDEDGLYRLLTQQAAHPPRVGITLKGNHIAGGFSVTDFNLKIDLSPCFQQGHSRVKCQDNVETQTDAWHKIKLAPPQAETYRGNNYKHTAGTELDTAPDLETWCHRFTQHVAKSKFPCEFVMKRKAVAWKEAYIKQSLQEMIRKTNYQGDLKAEVMVEDDKFTVYSDHWMFRARDNPIIFLICAITQLWILTWPILLMCTQRFEVVTSEWPMKQVINGQTVYASCSEQEWLDTWGEAAVNLAYRRQEGWVEETTMKRYGKLRRAYNESMAGASSNDGVITAITALVGYVDGRTGMMISPTCRGESIGPWGVANDGK